MHFSIAPFNTRWRVLQEDLTRDLETLGYVVFQYEYEKLNIEISI